MFPVIAIIGRPNVGKSSLFNRLIGFRHAVTSNVAGTTRDRISYETDLGEYRAVVVDTGGMEFDKKRDIEADIQAQARLAAGEADLILFVVDFTEPLTASDLDTAQFLRKSKKPIILVAHKADHLRPKTTIDELFSLGFGEAIPVSSIHNEGFLELEEAAEKMLKKMKWKKENSNEEGSVSIAIVGKPNVGKSSLVNALLGQERVIVSAKPGTTIDAINSTLSYSGKKFILVDTAGLRRRGRIQKGIEKFGSLRGFAAISRADIACLMIDGSEKISNQDLHISEYILETGKGLIIAVNKTDLMEDRAEDQKKFLDRMAWRMSYAPWAPVLFISALEKRNIFKILELAANIREERRKKVEPYIWDIFLKTTLLSHPPIRSSRKIVISKGYQNDVDPPTFTFECNHPDLIHFSYRRFLENEIRRKFGFQGTAVRLKFILNY